MQNALACANRIFDLLEEEEESPDVEGTINEVKGNVSISHVDFSYDKNHRLIEDFNLEVNPGMRIAIVGPTGCGKTTFINLLMRFYDVDQGNIKIDGKSIDGLSRHALRSSYGMVLQETWIKDGTVRENIAFGKPDATDEDIIRAAKEAHSWEFIERLPDWIQCFMKTVSAGGKKQLLCITRVMLCLPPMLILMRPSSIDTRTEQQIQEAFDKLMKGRTSFIVAHRLSTIRNASLILVMKDGKIIEQGTHEELLTQGGFYNKLYNSQFRGCVIKFVVII